jgi:hypothetical protein
MKLPSNHNSKETMHNKNSKPQNYVPKKTYLVVIVNSQIKFHFI